MTDLSNAPSLDNVDTAAENPKLLTFEVPNIDGEHTFDCSTIPADAQIFMLKNAVRAYIVNRVNAQFQRHQKDEDVKAWAAYDAAQEADALQGLVPKPATERPAAPDLAGTLLRALEDLGTGNIRRQTREGEPKTSKRKDPFVTLVTKTVIDRVYEKTRETNPKYTWFEARKAVGADGVEYLKNLVEEHVAAGADRAGLEKRMEEEYFKPARNMLGMTPNKALKDLPALI